MVNLKITTVIVTKGQDELNEFNSMLKKIDELSVVGKAITGNQGISLITNFAPELVFVNVDLQDVNGLEFVRVLQNRNIFPEIVFIAENPQYAYESLAFEPLDFLIKPIKREKIQEMLVRLKTKLRKKELIRKMDIFTKSNSVYAKRVFRQKGGIVTILLEEIVFCKAELTRTILVLRCGEKIHLKSGISETVETINSDDFIRISRSYCINRFYLRKIDKRHYKCHLCHEGQTWEVPTSKNAIGQLERLNIFPVY